MDPEFEWDSACRTCECWGRPPFEPLDISPSPVLTSRSAKGMFCAFRKTIVADMTGCSILLVLNAHRHPAVGAAGQNYNYPSDHLRSPYDASRARCRL